MSGLKTDTIAAIATAPGRSALAVIRISGPDSFAVADSILHHNRPTAANASHTLHYARVVDNTDTIDDVIVAVFHAPRSFSGENTVEISCHGGSIVVQRVLALIISSGARLAEPGEFTLRAYLNGKLDLAQAEAVIDTIEAKTQTALTLAKSQQKGVLSGEVNIIRDGLIGILARIEATIDFPEDVGEFPTAWCLSEIENICQKLQALINSASRGMLYRDGISVVLAGAPNAGKSSILNALLRSDRAIVTSVPGTTRDVIEEYIDIAGIPVRLSDTAGLRDTDDEVERIGVERTHNAMGAADIVIEVRDISNSEPAQLNISTDKPRILVYNKCDLAQGHYSSDLAIGVHVSAKTGEGISDLEAKIGEVALSGSESSAADSVIVTHTRHKNAFISANEALLRATQLLADKAPLDFVSIEVTSALTAIGQITGETAPEEIVNEIFHRFCIGK